LNPRIELIPLSILGDIKPNEDLKYIILNSIKQNNENLFNGDIIVIAQKIVSKSEGRIINLASVMPSCRAVRIAAECKKDARIVELILQESKDILRVARGMIIVETRQGFICANAGIDQSNVEDSDNNALLLPLNPDISANKIRTLIREETGKEIAVIISDTFGRPFREGQINIAVGIAGIEPIKNYVGTYDIYGKKLRVTEIAIADEIASAAELSMGKSDRIPLVIVRGYPYPSVNNCSISSVIRTKEKDLFR
jgi:coenzyme F420-0:L-glutamate ligase/coenzyme F420-1:gamma-L-glutamate ligase